MSSLFSIKLDDDPFGCFRVRLHLSVIGLDLPSILLGSFDSYPAAVDFVRSLGYRLGYECLQFFASKRLPLVEWSDLNNEK